jgi:hypothetical protein
MTGEVVPVAAVCTNCQAPLHGQYCSACGQRYEPHVHSVAEFASEALEGVTHADSRLWRTLWLLVSKPGFLTREFVEGRRMRYLPPFRLYLVLSVMLFLVIALVSHGPSETAEPVAPAAKALPGSATSQSQAPAAAAEPAAPVKTPEQRARDSCADTHFGIAPKSWEPRLKEGCYKMLLDRGHAFGQAMLHNIPRALFVLLPLLALVMSLMYWRRFYVEHLLFFLHNHSFTFLVLTVAFIGAAIFDSAWLLTLLVLMALLYPSYYTYKAMRRVYGQGRWMTRMKFGVLCVAYLALMLTIATFTILFSMVTL